MNRSISAVVVTTISIVACTAQQPSQPKITSEIEAPLKLGLSKIAPLEWWDFSWSDSGPMICAKFFRVDPATFTDLLKAIGDFQGHEKWGYLGDCLEPVTGMIPVSPLKPGASAPQPAWSPQPLSKQRLEGIMEDLRNLPSHVENQLHLTSAQPKSFSAEMLTKLGLFRSRPAFQDFVEEGERSVYLVVHPRSKLVFKPDAQDILLHFSPLDEEVRAIFAEILRIPQSLLDNRALGEGEKELIGRHFPRLWEISQYYDDAYLTPTEAAELYSECQKIDKNATSPAALRGLDKLMRIAHWASAKHYGILFSAP